MGQLAERISHFTIVGLDTSIFIYHFEGNPAYLPLTHDLLSCIETGQVKGVTSTITLMEIIVKPLALKHIDVARKYEAMIVNFPNLDIVDLDRDVIRQAARLRAEYRLRPPDAVQIAASLLYGAGAFVSNDALIKRLQNEIEVILLDDFTHNEQQVLAQTQE
jgi:predicted nucleic acid-binding protein